jgi:hypothetical protein
MIFREGSHIEQSKSNLKGLTLMMVEPRGNPDLKIHIQFTSEARVIKIKINEKQSKNYI